MRKKDAEGYLRYEASVPFLIPIPNIISKFVTAPMRMLIKKNHPENGKELLVTFLVYVIILILLSLPFVTLNWPSGVGWSNWPAYIPGTL